MNGLERILATISGNSTDIQPFTLLLSLYGAKLKNFETSKYYRDSNLWFEGQQAVIQKFDPDILISPFSLPIEAEAFGSELVFLDKYAPNVKKPVITNLSQLGDLQIPDLQKSASIQFFLKGTSLLAENYKTNKAIGCPISSPTDIPALLMGVEMWIDTLLFHPESVDKLMAKTVEHFVRLGNEYLDRGATFLIVPVNIANPMIITEKIFNRLIPYLNDAFNQIKGPIVIHNGGCKIMSFIDRYAKLPNVIAFVLEPGESFDQARQILGEKTVLMGNFDGPEFSSLSIARAREITLKILENRKDDRHFIFATSNADIPYDTTIEAIKAVLETIRNYKK